MTTSEYTNILLAALGTTPQIITESLYYLMVKENITIHEIHLITTTIGKQKAEKMLFQNGSGPFYRFFEEYGYSSTQVHTRYHVITDSMGKELADIRTPSDNQAAADFFLQVTRQLTTRPDTRIFATIAGGRKTMSAYLYLVMQLLGRDQDTLYHVLVQPESIESNPAFYYPHKESAEMEFTDRQGKNFTVPVNEIRIDMAEIPFVRMRRILREELAHSIPRFSELVASTQAELDKAQFEPELEVNLPEKALIVKDREQTYRIMLRPVQMCLYAYLCQKSSFLNSKAGAPEATKEMLKIYRTEYAIAGVAETSFQYDRIMQMRSKINRQIRKIIPQPMLQDFLIIHSDRKYGGATFRLRITPEKIRIHSTDPHLFS